MNQIIRYELYKISQKKINRVIVLIMFLLCVITYITEVDPFGKEMRIASSDGKVLTGKKAIEFDKEVANKYKGELSVVKLQNIYNEFTLSREEFLEISGKHVQWKYNTIYESVKPYFYLYGIGENNYSDKNISFNLTLDQIVIGYSQLWGSTINSMQHSFVFLGIVLIILISPLFSEEYSSGTVELLLVSSLGKQRKGIIQGKVLASVIVCGVLSILIIAVNFISTIFLVGGKGFDCTIQTVYSCNFKNIAGNYKVWQILIISFLLYLSSMYIITFLTIIVSSYNRTSYNTLIKTIAFYLAPAIFHNYISLPFITILTPIVQTDIRSILMIGSVNILGIKVMIIWIILIEAIFVFGVCKAIVFKKFSQYQVA